MEADDLVKHIVDVLKTNHTSNSSYKILLMYEEYIEAAKKLRRLSSMWREQLLQYQKLWNPKNEEERVFFKYFGEEANNELKKFRVFDYFVKYATVSTQEENENLHFPHGLEKMIAVCFGEVDLLAYTGDGLGGGTVYDKVLETKG